MTVAERKKDAVCLPEKCGKALPSAPGVPYQNTALYVCVCVDQSIARGGGGRGEV
jgi:hypothetical protein